MLGNSTKFATIGFNAIFLGTSITSSSMLGVIIALAGGALYSEPGFEWLNGMCFKQSNRKCLYFCRNRISIMFIFTATLAFVVMRVHNLHGVLHRHNPSFFSRRNQTRTPNKKLESLVLYAIPDTKKWPASDWDLKIGSVSSSNRTKPAAPHHEALFRDALSRAESAEGQLADLQKQNAALKRELEAETAAPQVEEEDAGVQLCDLEIVRRSKMIRFEFSGRTGNNLIQYLYARLLADSHNWGIIEPFPSERYNSYLKTDFFPNIRYFHIEGATTESLLDSSKGCANEFNQNYLYFQHARKFAKCISKPAPDLLKFPEIGEKDIVIHYRDSTEEDDDKIQRNWVDSTVPQLEYFTSIIDMLWNDTNDSTIHFLSEPRLRQNHKIIDGLSKIYPKRVRVSHGSPEEDMSIGYRAPILITSSQTFSWWMAYTSSARRIFMVYRSDLPQGSNAFPGADMFIHDDPRILFHDVSVYPVQLETARQVLSKNTPFADTVLNRRKNCLPLNDWLESLWAHAESRMESASEDIAGGKGGLPLEIDRQSESMMESPPEDTGATFRLVPVSIRTANYCHCYQVSEFRFFDIRGNQIAPTSATNPGGNNPSTESPRNLIDDNINSKFLDFNMQPAVFTFKLGVSAVAYAWVTGNDAPERDLISWRLEGKQFTTDTTWTTLHTVSNYATTLNRNAVVGPFYVNADAPEVLEEDRLKNMMGVKQTDMTPEKIKAHLDKSKDVGTVQQAPQTQSPSQSPPPPNDYIQQPPHQQQQRTQPPPPQEQKQPMPYQQNNAYVQNAYQQPPPPPPPPPQQQPQQQPQQSYSQVLPLSDIFVCIRHRLDPPLPTN